MEQIIELVNDKKVGDEVTLKLLRGGQEKTATVTLGKRPRRSKKPRRKAEGSTPPPGGSPAPRAVLSFP